MAVDGRKLKKCLYKGSDEDHDFPCSPCSKEGNNVAAIKHCVECDENLCNTCVDHHNKFSVMRSHQLLDKAKSSRGRTLELPNQRCETHGGKLIDVYCPNHDKVGCSTCMNIEHSGCQGITFIPDIASKTKTSESLLLLEKDICSLQSCLKSFIQTAQKDLETTQREKEQLLCEIRSQRKKINNHLDKMEADLLREVGDILKDKIHCIESNMEEADAKIASLQENLNKVKAAKCDNASDVYVQVHVVKEETRQASQYLERIRRSSFLGKLRFKPCRYEPKCNAIGNIIHLQNIIVENVCEEFSIQTIGDKKTCTVTDMCICEDGCIVLVDSDNKRIKKMNNSFKVISSIAVKDNPVGICLIDLSLLAVTLINDKKVQFISQKEKMKLQQSFNVGGRCRGIACKDGVIYVCCGGLRGHKEEGIGHLEVYTISGELLTSYYGAIECPRRVSISNNTPDIFVTDEYKGILVIDKNQSEQTITFDKGVYLGLRCICWINESRACFAFWMSNNILLMSIDGNEKEELLTGKDGLASPIGLIFDKKLSRLVVSFNISNTIKVFKLKICD